MATLTSTPISSHNCQVGVGGDIAAIKGLMKAMIEAADAAAAADRPRVLDTEFIHGHTRGFDALAADLRTAPWDTIVRQSGLSRAQLAAAVEENPHQKDPSVLRLTTMRSHDQYNTTLYALSDRYRGVFGQRDVVFLNAEEMQRRGLAPGDRVDLVAASTDGVARAVRGFKVVEYALPDASCGAYYPETNPLVPLYAHDTQSHTPSSKSIPIRLVRSQGA